MFQYFYFHVAVTSRGNGTICARFTVCLIITNYILFSAVNEPKEEPYSTLVTGNHVYG